MPFELPNLDDRRYDDLVAEALARIPIDAPEWTNYNPSDPGITLVELFAHLTDMLLYRLNRVPEANTRKFLKLLNASGWERGDLHDEIENVVLGVRECYRAVTQGDYEFLSTEGFNAERGSVGAIERAHCVPNRNFAAATEEQRLQPQPGHVSVVILPAPEKPHPAPSGGPQPTQEQIDGVKSFLDKRRMLGTRLHVVPPSYAYVSAKLVIGRRADALAENIKQDVETALAGLLNPRAWPFGRDIFVSDIYKTLEGIQGIDFVSDVMLESQPQAGDDKSAIWHSDGDLIGLAIEEHQLPLFDRAEPASKITIAPRADFLIVSLTVTITEPAPLPMASDVMRRTIKKTVRGFFDPSIVSTIGPASTQDTQIILSKIGKQIASDLQTHASFAGQVSVSAECVPSDILTDGEISVAARKLVEWRTTVVFN